MKPGSLIFLALGALLFQCAAAADDRHRAAWREARRMIDRVRQITVKD